jgi:hypothetical protein
VGEEGTGMKVRVVFFLRQAQKTSSQEGMHHPRQINSEQDNCNGLSMKKNKLKE